MIIYERHLYTMKDETYSLNLNLHCGMTVILGDSGEGKTFMCSQIKKIQERSTIINTKDILVVDNYQLFTKCYLFDVSLIIFDKTEVYCRDNDLVDILQKCGNKDTLIFYRGECFLPYLPSSVAFLHTAKNGNIIEQSITYLGE